MDDFNIDQSESWMGSLTEKRSRLIVRDDHPPSVRADRAKTNPRQLGGMTSLGINAIRIRRAFRVFLSSDGCSGPAVTLPACEMLS